MTDRLEPKVGSSLAGRPTDRPTERLTNRANKPTDRLNKRPNKRPTDQGSKQTTEQTNDRPTDKSTDRQIPRPISQYQQTNQILRRATSIPADRIPSYIPTLPRSLLKKNNPALSSSPSLNQAASHRIASTLPKTG